MLVYRILCAILMALAVTWALARPEAEIMVTTIPEVGPIGLIAGAIVGYFNLAVRQGWGFIVAFANGIWAGVLAVVLSGVICVIFGLVQGLFQGLVQDLDTFVRLFGDTARPLFGEITNVPLLIVSLGATAIVGVVTEIVHWMLVRVRARKSGRAGPASGGM